MYVEYFKECQRECQRAYNAYINSFIEAENGNVTKRLWSFIKHQKKINVVYPQYMLMILLLQTARKNPMHSTITLHQYLPKKTCQQYRQ